MKECKLCNEVFEAGSNSAKYCLTCRATKEKEWRKAAHFKYRDERIAKMKEYNRSHYQLNRESMQEKHKAYNKDYYQRTEVKAACASKSALRRSDKVRATPSWFDEEIVELIYLTAQDISEHVDHIVPLKSDLVCGLHVQNNMQIIPAEINLKKSNTWWPQMPVEGS